MKYEGWVSYIVEGVHASSKDVVKICEGKTIAECKRKINIKRNDVFGLNDIWYSEIRRVTSKETKVLHRTIYCYD